MMRSATSSTSLAATLVLLLLAGGGVDAAAARFPRAVSGDGFLAVPVGTINKAKGNTLKGRSSSDDAFETVLKNYEFFYATEGE